MKYLVIYSLSYIRKGKPSSRVLHRYLKTIEDYNDFLVQCFMKNHKILKKFKLEEID